MGVRQTVRQRLALERSVKQWAKKAAHPDLAAYRRQFGPRNCACCREYFARDCEGCPIAEDSGQIRCLGTPYTDVIQALKAADYSEAAKAVVREYNYLEKVLAKLPSAKWWHVLLLPFLLLSSGCSFETGVTPRDAAYAMEACLHNGGEE